MMYSLYNERVDSTKSITLCWYSCSSAVKQKFQPSGTRVSTQWYKSFGAEKLFVRYYLVKCN